MTADIKYLHTNEIHNLSAPEEIVPYLIKAFKPQSVIDIGCGWGTFLKVFYDHGITDITGIDGKWVKKEDLLFPQENFVEADLETKIDFNRKYDIAVSLEVAEHLHDSKADMFVQSLTGLSDVIIFSAALVNQGGQNHINEQPVSYWMKKFAAYGFAFHDVFRAYFWNNEKVDWWYAQNMFLVTKSGVDITSFELPLSPAHQINEYIHPDLFAKYAGKRRKAEKQLSELLAGRASVRTYLGIIKRLINYRLFKK